MPAFSSKNPLSLLLHGALLAVPLALLAPALKALDTPLPDGSYRAIRGYGVANLNCPARIEISGVEIKDGVITFESGEVRWRGTIDTENGVIRIEAPGVTPKPSGDLHIRGHHSRASLYSDFCGRGYFRILR